MSVLTSRILQHTARLSRAPLVVRNPDQDHLCLICLFVQDGEELGLDLYVIGFILQPFDNISNTLTDER